MYYSNSTIIKLVFKEMWFISENDRYFAFFENDRCMTKMNVFELNPKKDLFSSNQPEIKIFKKIFLEHF